MNLKNKKSSKPINAATQFEIQPSVIEDETTDEEAYKYSRFITEKICSNKASHEHDLKEREKVNQI